MTKTSTDVVQQALRMGGLLEWDVAAPAEDFALGVGIMSGVLAELQDDLTIAWTIDTVPDMAWLAFAEVVEADMTTATGRQSRIPRGRALLRLRKCILDDNRKVIEDLDDDNTVSTAEEGVRDRMLYY